MPLRPIVLALALACVAGAAQRRDTLIYSRFDIDPGEWRYFPFPSKASGARLDVRFEVVSPKDCSGVRVALQREGEFQKFSEKQPHRDLSASAYRREGGLRTRLAEPGNFVVVIDNRIEGRRKCRVELEVSLVTGPDPETLPVAYASPHKRLVVVSVSLAGFFLIVGLAGAALWRAAQRNRRAVIWS